MSTEVASYITSQYRIACERNDFDTRNRLYATAEPHVSLAELDVLEMEVAQAKGRKQRAQAASYWRTVKSAQMAKPLN